MDPKTIATVVVGFLAPYLTKSGEEIAKKIGEGIYEKLRSRFAKKPAARAALTDLEKAPTDENAQAAVRLQLNKILTEDEEFANELSSLIEKTGETEAGRIVITQIGGDNATMIGSIKVKSGDVTIGKQ